MTAKSPLNTTDLKEFKHEIEAELERHRLRLDDLEKQREDLRAIAKDNVSKWEDTKSEEKLKETSALIDNHEQKIDELEAALNRIQNNTYGICEKTGDYIGKEALIKDLTATTCAQ